MKNLLTILALLLIEVNLLFGQVAVDPYRGMYVDQFATTYNGTYISSFSILGVDVDHNGVFEKEQELLQFASENHITSLTLYDVGTIFSSNAPKVWNEIDSRFETLPEHLCRFMSDARNNFCIKEIFGAVGGADEANDIIAFNNLFSTPSPAFAFTQDELNSPFMTSNLIALAQSYPIGDAMLVPSEIAKTFLRALNMTGCDECDQKFSGFSTELEFWNSTSSIPTNENDYLTKFKPLLTNLDQIKALYNAGPSDDISINVYYGKYATLFSRMTCPECPVEFIDGCQSNCTIACPSYCDAVNPKKGDRIYLEEYFRTTTQFNYLQYENAYSSPLTTDNTDLHPLFSAENKMHGAADDFFGRWILEGPSNGVNEQRSIFLAENIHYAGWKTQAGTGTNENDIEPGGYEWFTSSYLLRSFKNPPLFYSDAPVCSSNVVTFTYIGPREENIHYTFKLTDNATNVVLNYSGYTPNYLPPYPNDFLTDPTLNLAASPYTAELTLDFGNGCAPITYKEEIVLTNSLKASAIGFPDVTQPIGACEGNQIILKASWNSSNVRWFKGSTDLGITGQYLFVTESGIYHCEKTAGSCQGISNSITINFDFSPYVQIAAVCSTTTALTLKAEVSNLAGYAPGSLKYSWNTGATTDEIIVTSAKNYKVTVTNIFNSCESFNTISVSDPPFPTSSFAVSASPISCANGVGSVDITIAFTSGDNCRGIVTDGISSRYVTWFSANTNVANLSPGSYNVWVTKNNKPCSATTSFNIGNQTTFTFNNPSITNATCHGVSNGSISITGISGGTSPYTFSWAGISSSNTTNTSTSTLVNGLPAGTYTLKITDNACNFQYINYIITEPTGISVTASIQNVNCNGGSTGGINQTITGATYLWNYGGLVSQDLSGVPAGTYVCTITKNGCSEDFTYQIDQNSPIEVHLISATTVCANSATGYAHIKICGGIPMGSAPYYNVLSPWTLYPATTDEFEILNQLPGAITVDITDDIGCNVITNVTIPSYSIPVPVVNPSSASFCAGGSAVLDAGAGYNSYLWSNSLATQTITVSTAGNYSVTVTDANGCTGTSPSVPVTVNANPTPSITPSGSTTFCDGESVILDAGIYTSYLWSTNAASQTIAVTQSGNYSVTVTDANGCSGTSPSVTVTVNPLPATPAAPTSNSPQCEDIGVDILHGTPPIGVTWYWQTSPTGTSTSISSSPYHVTASGTYYLRAQDDNTLCWSAGASSIAVTVFLNPTVSIVPNTTSGCLGTELCAASQTFPSYSWTPLEEYTPCITAIEPAIYGLSVVDVNGCTGSTTYNFTGMNQNCCGNFGSNNFTFTEDPAPTGNYNLNTSITMTDDLTITGCTLAIAPGVTITTDGHILTINNSFLFSCGDMWGGIINNGGTVNVTGNSTIIDANLALLNDGLGSLAQIENSTFDMNYTAIAFKNSGYANSYVRGCTIKCTNNFITKPLHLGQQPPQQILVMDATDVKIGDPGNGNNISDALNGILGIRSSIEVYSNTFTNIRNHLPMLSACYAVSTKGDNLNDYTLIVGTSSADFNTISDCQLGIWATQGMNCSIAENYFSLVTTGITVTNCNDRTIAITSNHLSLFKMFGIYLSDNNNSEVHVDRNWMNDLMPFSVANESRKGIYVGNTYQSRPSMTINENHIYNCRYGIHVLNQDNCYITANKIYYLLNDADIIADLLIYRNGITVSQCYSHHYGFQVSYNEIYHTNCTCPNTDPTLNSHLRGISVERSWVEVHDNYANYLPTAARVLDNCNGTQFYCNYWDNGQQGYFFDLQYSLLAQGNGTFSTNNAWDHWIGTYKIEKCAACALVPLDWYYDIAGSSGTVLDPNTYEPSIIAPINALPNNEECTGIYGGGGGGHQDKLMRIINDSSYVDNLDENKYHDREVAYKHLKDSLELMYAGTAYDANLQNFFTLMALSNTGVLEDIKEYLVNNDQASALLANANFNPANLMEANSKLVNTICLQHAGDTITYDSLQRIQLFAIAYQLPMIGGEAVYRARAILKIDVDDTQLEFRMQNNPKEITLSDYSLYPNPNSGTFSISYLLDEKQTGSVTVFDNIGKIISQLSLEPKQQKTDIDLSKHSNGIYFVRLVTSNSVNKFWKVVVLR